MDCLQTFSNYVKTYNYGNANIEACVEKTSKKLGISKENVCNAMIDKLRQIEEKCVSKSKDITLKDYQRQAVKMMMRQRGIVLGFEVGSGKTLTAIAISTCLIRQAALFKKKVKVVVITPVSLQDNFKKEMVKFGLRKTDDRFIFYTISGFYNAMIGKGRKGHNPDPFDCKNTVLIIDEAHNIRTDYRGEFGLVKKSGDNSRAPQFIDCAKKAWKTIMLTGTPIYNEPYDILNLAAMARGEEPIDNERYTYLMDEANPKARKKFDEYFGCLFLFYASPTRESYPKKISKLMGIKMDEDYLKAYENLEKSKEGKDGKKSNAFLTAVRQGSNGIPPFPKAAKAAEIIKKGEKTLVYSEYLEAGINTAKTKLDEEDISYYEITGKVPKAQRQKIANDFNKENNKTKVLLITPAAREGLDLKGVRNVVLLEPGWNDSGGNQAEGRAIRFESHKHLPENQRNVTVWHFLLIKPQHENVIREAHKLKKKGEHIGISELNEAAKILGVKNNFSVDMTLFGLGGDKTNRANKLIQRLKNATTAACEA